jgi:ribosome-interacting GTPase 1
MLFYGNDGSVKVSNGPANVGKSDLVSALTNATPEIADFPHTTLKPNPGMMPSVRVYDIEP